eukprot:TRINITY_DN33503_c0_g1_i1.p1 TRINITY_DN33503_c0_g1~~TRINITY_DN33503_c0_g1_i1.p1  ORF type:complete len:721 (-),score=235.00 TRINITY_DN33503_c0_g1_i1:25-2187(-)
MLAKLTLVFLPVALQAATLHENSGGNPVRKVLDLLAGMQSKLEEDASVDQHIYDKQACWCKSNIEEKTESVEKAKKRIEALTNGINMLSTASARLKAESSQLGKDITKANTSIADLVARRQDQRQVFIKYEKTAMNLIAQVVAAEQSIAAASNATGNSTANGTGFLQHRTKAGDSTLAHLKKEVAKQIALFAEGENSNIQAFLNSPLPSEPTGQAFLQRRGAAAMRDSPQASEAVMGVLTGLERDFIANLGDLRTKETQQLMTFKKLHPAKESELKAMVEQKANKAAAATDADLKRANNKKVIKNLNKQIGEDSGFLANVTDKCRLVDKEWDERQKTRLHETEALAQTMDILKENYENSDSFNSLVQDSAAGKSAAAHRDFWNSIASSSFLQQEEEASSSSRHMRIFQTLLQAGKKHDARLVSLAMQSKVDSFTRVKESIDAMVKVLDKEMKDEVKHRDYCIEELNVNQLDTEDKTRTSQTQSAAVMEMQANIREASDAASALKAEIAEMEKQIKAAAENREEENKEFQGLVEEQRVTQRALSKALSVMADFYSSAAQTTKSTKTAGLVQLSQPEYDAQPEGFKEMKKNSGGLGVVTFLQQLIEDAKTMEAEAMKGEMDAQAAYEDFAKETTLAIKTKTAGVEELEDGRAKEDQRKVQKEEEKQLTISEIAQLAITKEQLHNNCDFLLAQFEVRQKARGEEMDALRQAKAILSGASFGSD